MLIGLIIVNVLSFLVMGIDKKRAIDDRYRIPEKTLLLTSVCFGSIGFLLGMKIFHHKTKKFYFKLIGLLSLLLQTIFILKIKGVL